MIHSKTIIDLLKKYDWTILEPHIIYHYLNEYSLDYKNCEVLSNYFDGFELNDDSYNLVSKISFESIKDLESTLELLIPSSDKILNGAFFTPSYIVDFIINTIQPKQNDKCIDPSCGGGAFLIGLCDYYKQNYNKSVSATIKENVFGSDILEYNITRSKIILSIYGLHQGEYIKEQDFNLICTDSLKYSWEDTFDCIVGNPPYVKFQDLLDETRFFLVNNWRSCQKGTYNLYFAFFELGHKLLSEKGKLGYITPNNYFTSLAGECLRDFFDITKCIYKIVDFNSTKVFDVQTYTAITFLNKKENRNIEYDRIEYGVKPFDYLKNISFSISDYKELNTKKWRLLKDDEKENIHQIENIGTPIKNLFSINVGIATLKDELFFIDIIQDNGSIYTIDFKGEKFEIEKEITKSLYKISDFKSQEDIISNKRRIIFPYCVDGKTANIISEDEIKIKYPLCYKYFISIKDKLLARNNGKIYPFYAYGRTQGLTKQGIKLLTPTFSQYPRFLIVDDIEALFTNGYGIYFDKQAQKNIFDDVHLLSLEQNIDVLQKVLNSAIMDYYVKKTSVSIEGGYPCYQKNFIEKFTIPNLTNDELSILRNLSDKTDIDDFLIEKYQVNLFAPNLVS